MTYYTDGSKSSMGCKIAVTDEAGNLLYGKDFEEDLTNNELEYEGIVACLELCANDDLILTDAKLCVEQVKGNYEIKKKNLEPYVLKIREIIKDKNIKIEWISREENPAGKFLEKQVKANARKRNRRTTALREIEGEQIQ